MPHRYTWAAIIVGFVIMIPAMFIGGIVSILWTYIVGGMMDGGVLDWISGGWSSKLFLSIFPNLLHGAIGGGLGLYITAKIFRYANYEITAYALSSLVVIFAILGGLLNLAEQGLNLGIIELIANTIGVVVGLFFVQQSVHDEQKHRHADAAAIPFD